MKKDSDHYIVIFQDENEESGAHAFYFTCEDLVIDIIFSSDLEEGSIRPDFLYAVSATENGVHVYSHNELEAIRNEVLQENIAQARHNKSISQPDR